MVTVRLLDPTIHDFFIVQGNTLIYAISHSRIYVQCTPFKFPTRKSTKRMKWLTPQ